MQQRVAHQNRIKDETEAGRNGKSVREEKTDQVVITKKIRYVPTITADDAFKVPNLQQGIELADKKEEFFTHEDAKRELSRPEFLGERPLREDHAAVLMLAVMEGIFRQESVEIITAYNRQDGVTYRMNGRHTAQMLVELQGVKGYENTRLKVRKLHYHVDNMEAMRTLYSSIDRGAPRTTSHLIITLLAGTPGFEGIPHDVLRRLAEGFGLWFWPSGHKRRIHGPEHRAFLMKGDFRVVTLNAAKIISPGKDVRKDDFRHLLRSPVMAAMIGTYRANTSQAVSFWEGVRDGLNLPSKTHPMSQLRMFLLNTGVADRGSSMVKKKLSTEQMLVRCLYAWNWYIKGEQGRLSSLKLNLQRPTIVQRA